MKPGWYDIPNEEYHNDPKYKFCLTSTGLKEFAKSPAHWLAWRDKPSETTPALKFGQAYHWLMLEPEKFGKYVFVFEGRKYGKKYDAFLGQLPEGALVVSPDEATQLWDMKIAIRKHLIANSLTRTGTMIPEQAGFFKLEGYSFWCSIKPDIRNKNLQLLADVKSAISAHPVEFSKSVGNFKYHWQAWLYLAGARVLDGFTYKDWLWLTQEKTYPYPVVAYRATERMLMRAQGQIIPLLSQFQWCIENDQWPSYFPDDRVIDIELPRWA